MEMSLTEKILEYKVKLRDMLQKFMHHCVALAISTFYPCSVTNAGGSTYLNNNNRSFCDLLQRTDLIDLGFSGPAFTWTNSQFMSRPIFQRLAKAIVGSIWQKLFPQVHVKHLPMIYPYTPPNSTPSAQNKNFSN
jgi:hypothetical protein